MTPEARARQTIDALLTAAGWHVCDVAGANLHAGSGVVKGVAIREFQLNPGHGFADYLLYVNGKACGVIEAKKEGATLIGVEVQSARYAQGLPAALPLGAGLCPLCSSPPGSKPASPTGWTRRRAPARCSPSFGAIGFPPGCNPQRLQPPVCWWPWALWPPVSRRRRCCACLQYAASLVTEWGQGGASMYIRSVKRRSFFEQMRTTSRLSRMRIAFCSPTMADPRYRLPVKTKNFTVAARVTNMSHFEKGRS
jgi:type I restriction enzyme R subunit